MVLKVVTGKIFKTLELRWSSTACGSVLGTTGDAGKKVFALTRIGRTQPLVVKGLRPCQVVKERGYLMDNQSAVILS